MRLPAIGVLCIVATACCRRPPPVPTLSQDGAPPAAASSGQPPEPAASSRCVRPTDDKVFTFGESQGAIDDEIAPFGVEIGQSVATTQGFAIGALAPQGKNTNAVVLLLDAAAANPVVVKMALALGDTPAPAVTSRGDLLLASLLEAGPNGRHLRIAKIENGAVVWGPTFDQGRDESLSFDVAIGEARALAVWDDDETKPERGVIRLATFAPKTLGAPTAPRTVTLPQTDAESPRIVPRAGGFWLVYVARKPEKTDDSAREQAETAEHRWLEALPLDENGAGVGLPRRLTPESGHVLAYSLAAGANGTAFVVYRDDDLPSGGSGGLLNEIVLRADGAGPPTTLADTDLGAGVPTLLPGWISVADVSAETRLGRMDGSGNLDGKLEREPVFGLGVPIAARGDVLLVQRPIGRGVRLFVTTCR